MRDDYDFSKSTKNPYAKKLKKQVTIRLDEDTIDYFKDLAGEDIEPAAEDAPEEEEKAKPWGVAIGLCSLFLSLSAHMSLEALRIRGHVARVRRALTQAPALACLWPPQALPSSSTS